MVMLSANTNSCKLCLNDQIQEYVTNIKVWVIARREADDFPGPHKVTELMCPVSCCLSMAIIKIKIMLRFFHIGSVFQDNNVFKKKYKRTCLKVC